MQGNEQGDLTKRGNKGYKHLGMNITGAVCDLHKASKL